MKHELQRIISGKSQVRNGTVIQTTTCYLKRSQRTSKLVKESKFRKKQEESDGKEKIQKSTLTIFVY
jgi:hypothetical protein